MWGSWRYEDLHENFEFCINSFSYWRSSADGKSYGDGTSWHEGFTAFEGWHYQEEGRVRKARKENWETWKEKEEMSGKFWFWSIVTAVICGAIAGKVLSIIYLVDTPIL